MKLPIQVSSVERRNAENFADLRTRESVIIPSCDPNTQITCGSHCCNAQYFYCGAGNTCQPIQ